MKKDYARYTVRVRGYQGGRMFEVRDEYWDSRESAFIKPDGTFYSTKRGTEKVLREAPGFLATAKAGHCYQITTEGIFGAAIRSTEVPTTYFTRGV